MTYEKGDTMWFDREYARVIEEIVAQCATKNTRTGKWVRAVPGAFFKIPADKACVLGLRNISPLWSCAEAIWFLSGARSPGLMKKYGFEVWDKFADSDGQVDSATGFRWRTAHGVDQLLEVFQKLKADPSNRQAVMLSWIPKKDLVNPGPNAPCIIAWHFQIEGGALHMSAMQRSGDMYFGFPHDVLGFRIVQELMAAGLGVARGSMNYLVCNAHLYEDQWLPASIMVDRARHNIGSRDFSFGLGAEDWKRALHGDAKLPNELFGKLKGWYKPWPAIDGPRLAL